MVLVLFNDMQLVSGVSGDMAFTRPGLVPRKTTWRIMADRGGLSSQNGYLKISLTPWCITVYHGLDRPQSGD